MKKLTEKPYRLVLLIIFLLMTGFNILAWYAPKAMDFYHLHIYAPAASLLSRICGIFPFSVGEFLIAIAILLCISVIISVIITIISKKEKGLRVLTLVLVFALCFVYTTETMNCFVLFHTTELGVRMAKYEREEYSTEDLVDLCMYMIRTANELAPVLNRDDKGNIILPDDLDAEAITCFDRLTDDFPELAGYCPMPKPMIVSTLMTQLDLQGVYFPFTLEGNYNAYISPARVPTTTFHEMIHIKGFIREDEATFLACAACMESDCPEIRYSACIEGMNYLFAECKKFASAEQIYSLRAELTTLVAKDNYFVSEEHMKKAEESVLPKEQVQKAGEKAMETTLKVNGVADGKNSYSRMTKLMLIWAYRPDGFMDQ